MSNFREARIILIGKTGVGKSSVGNTILGTSRFTVGSGSSSVTRRCQKETAVIADRRVTVVDTPDFFHSTHEEDLVSEMDQSVTLSSPGVHAFLYVFKPTAFTTQEAETVSQFKQTYGEEVFRHTIVLFTHGDQLQRVDINRLISQNESLMNLVRLCGGRFTVLNNEAPADREQVSYLLGLIDRMVSENENSFYTLEMLQEAQRRAEELREMRLTQQHRQEEMARQKHLRDLERAERETEIRVRKEMEEERKKARAVKEEEDKYSTKREISSAEQELQKRDRKLIYDEYKGKCWHILKTIQFQIIIIFSIVSALILSEISADSWACVSGCVLGASATTGGLITGKTLALVLRNQFRMSCIIKVFIIMCGGLVGSSIMYIGSKEIPVLALGLLGGGIVAHTTIPRAHV